MHTPQRLSVGILACLLAGLISSHARAACGDGCPGEWSTVTAPAPGSVSSLAYAPDGRLFVGLAANGLRVYGPNAGGTYQWTSIVQSAGGLASNSVKCLAIFHHELWVGTANAGISILDLDDGSWGQVNVANSNLPSDAINRITVIVPPGGASASKYDWQAWVSTNAGAARYRCSTIPGPPPRVICLWSVIDQADGLPDGAVRDIAVQTVGETTYTWIATTSSLMRWDGSTMESFAGSGGMATANRMLVDGTNHLWCDSLIEVPTKATYEQDGLYRRYFTITGYKWQTFDDKYGKDMSLDPHGRIWFGSAGNLTHPHLSGGWMYDNGAWCVFKLPDTPLVKNEVNAVLGLGEMTYFGHPDTTTLSVYSPNWESYAAGDMAGSGLTRAVLVQDGKLFVGVGGGVSWREADGTTWSNNALAGNPSAVRALCLAGDTLWVGTSGNGIFALTLGTPEPEHWTTAEGLANNDVRAIVVDRKDRIWAATSGGLALRANGYWLNLTAATSSLPNDQLQALALDKLDRLWIGAGAGGIAIFDPNGLGASAWSFVTTADGLPSDSINGIAPSGNDMWVATEAGAAQLVGATKTWVVHNVAGGALPDDRARCVAGDTGRGRGRVWIGTHGGLALYEHGQWSYYHPSNSLLGSDLVTYVDADWGTLLVGGSSRLALRKSLPSLLGDYPPEIASFTPTSGAAGTEVTVTGNYFDTRGPEFNTVFVGTGDAASGQPAPAAEIVSVTATQLVFKVPLLAKSGKVHVIAHCLETVSAASFQIKPGIDSVAPTRLGRGELLTISGSGFSADGGVEFRIGSGPWRRPFVDSAWDTQKPDELRVRIDVDDTSGPVTVRSSNGQTATSSQSVTISEVTITNVHVQQAYEGVPLVWGKRTLVQASVQASGSGAHIEWGRLSWKLIDGTTRGAGIGYTAAPNGTAVDIDQGDPVTSGVAFVAEFHSNRSFNSDFFPLVLFNGMRIELLNRDVPVAVAEVPRAQFLFVDYGIQLRVRCMAVLQEGGTVTWDAFWQRGIEAMGEVARIFPQQDHRWLHGPNAWLGYSPIYITSDHVEIDDNEGDAIGEVDDLLDPAYDTIGVALVQEELYVDGTPPGTTPWIALNSGGGQTIMAFNIEDTAGKIMAHECGHALGFSDHGNSNYDDDNPESGHSMYDDGVLHDDDGPEIPQPCELHENLTLYQAAIDQLGFAARIYRLDGGPPARFSAQACGGANHGYALMSYAAGRANGNCFFDPLEYVEFLAGCKFLHEEYDEKEKGEGDTLRLRGVLPESGPLRVTVSYVEPTAEVRSLPVPRGAYALVLRGSGGAELLRHPFEISTRSAEKPVRNPRFSLAVEFPDGTARAEIRRGDEVFWSANVTPNAPKVAFAAPSGGTFRAENIVGVAWTASDADNRDLQFALDYTPDGGTTWYPIAGYLTGTTFQWTPGFVPGSMTGQLRIRASDGFNTEFALSPTFRLAAAAPLVFIDQPKPGASVMEGTRVDLVAHSVAASGPDGGTFTWSVDGTALQRSGATAEHVFDEVGDHTIAVRVQDAAQQATATTTITVIPDYDGDGIPNDYELARKFNPVDRRDAALDLDADGLTNLSEFTLGTDPLDDDSDNDGVLDGEEVERGNDPTNPQDVPPVGPVLQVGASGLGFVVEAGAGRSDARTIWVTNRGSGQLAWSVQSSAAWVEVDPVSDSAPSEVTVAVAPGALGIGTYTAELVFTSGGAAGSPATVPIRLQVIESLGVKGFIRADSNMDKNVNIADAINTLSFLFAHGTPPPCKDAADANDDGKIDIADAIYTLSVLFAHAVAPKPPYPGCGVDPTNDALPCDKPRDCE